MPAYRTLLPLFDELRGERVLVRPFRADDAEALRAAVDESREHVRPWLPFADAHQTVEETRDWIIHGIAHWLLRESFGCGIWEAQDGGRFLGGVGLHIRDWDAGSFEIGYWLRASAEGHGYMAEAVRLLADFAFAGLAANRVEIRCDARNRRSAGVAERLGFVREGLLRNCIRRPDGTLRDTLVFALTPDDPRWPLP
jgi:RimJ/RimL family protein N-acetyltransferase